MNLTKEEIIKILICNEKKLKKTLPALFQKWILPSLQQKEKLQNAFFHALNNFCTVPKVTNNNVTA